MREAWERDVAYNQGRQQENAGTSWVASRRWRRRFWISAAFNVALVILLLAMRTQ